MKYQDARALKAKELALNLALQMVPKADANGQTKSKTDWMISVVAESVSLEGGILEYIQREIPANKVIPFQNYDVW
jgi:hypothetical protein